MLSDQLVTKASLPEVVGVVNVEIWGLMAFIYEKKMSCSSTCCSGVSYFWVVRAIADIRCVKIIYSIYIRIFVTGWYLIHFEKSCMNHIQ